ncbi:glycosyltransferase [Sulfurovum sp. CS9]|uniref:glycosyltransferase n=1 Tax=Sulfurovum sp. CS9 TaxID=3391146 RepID=UPI0039EB559D
MQYKKLLFIADARFIHTAKWIDYFISKGYDVHLATFAPINNTKCQNIYYLGKRETKVSKINYHYIFGIPKLTKIIKKIKPDIMNAHFSYSMGLVSLIAKKYSGIDCRFSVVCHGTDVLDPPIPLIFNSVNKYLLNKSDKIYAVSDQINDKLNDFGIDLEKVFVGQYGIDIEKKSLKKDIDILSNRNYVNNSKIDFLLNSLKKYQHDGLNIVFVLPHIDNTKLDKLKKEYQFIKFYQHVSHEKMMTMISTTKIYISATKSDGTSLSLMEAMQNDAVPLVSNIISNRSWILDSVNGYLFNTKKEFIDKLDEILDLDDHSIERINRINNDLILEKCIYNKQMKKIEEFLTEPSE